MSTGLFSKWDDAFDGPIDRPPVCHRCGVRECKRHGHMTLADFERTISIPRAVLDDTPPALVADKGDDDE